MNKKFKYFFISDSKKEAVGRVNAKDLHEAYIKASYIKKLVPMHFKEIFDVQEINE
jgi:hypothetical protein